MKPKRDLQAEYDALFASFTCEHESKVAAANDRLAGIEEEYRALSPQLEAEMELEHWQKRRRELQKVLQVRRRRERSIATLCSASHARQLALGADMKDVIWEETIGRIAYGDIFIRLQLYRADIHIAHLKTPGSRLRLQRWEGMEAGAFAAFAEMREAAIARMRAVESDPLVDYLASGGNPHIVKPGDGGNEKPGGGERVGL